MPNRLKKSMKRLAAAVCITLSCVMPCAAQEFLPVSEVQEGMHGYAKTVVHGTKIETFDVDVLGIMKDKGATGGDLVLVKVSGPLIDQTEGIAQGMSGSPVYIDGKLLGAVAYGFPQSGGRIGMVTPIGDMLKLWTIDDRKDTGLTPPPSKGLIPLTTPLMASGYTPEAMDFLTGKMQDFHMVPFASASASQDDVPQPLEPGSAVSATMVTGDLKLGAVGTVTYVDAIAWWLSGILSWISEIPITLCTIPISSPSSRARISPSSWGPSVRKSARSIRTEEPGSAE